MRTLLRSGALVLLATLLWRHPALPWDAPEHRAVARVAETLLSPEARREVAKLLGRGVDLAQVAFWADEIRAARPETAPWHYVNIPRSAVIYDATRDCRIGCVVSALDGFLAVVSDRQASRERRQEALRWVVHLAADIHQPLHAADDHDGGGNNVAVSLFGVPSTLHRVWDGEIVERSYPDPEALITDVLVLVTVASRSAWEIGSPAEWATEAHRLAVRVAYAIPPDGALDQAYAAQALSAIHEQLARAGVRLAWLLNRTLGRP